MPTQSRFRRGISLLEVLISMGVVAIGLVGAISLMPVAGNSAATAALETRKGQMGRRAIDEFFTRGMNDPRCWVSIAGNRWVNTANYYANSSSPNTNGWALKNAYCIDPLYMIIRADDASFPHKSGQGPSMPRVSLRTMNSTGTAAIGLPMAREIFEERDVLDITAQEDKTLPALQEWDLGTNGPLRRRTEDKKFSWFATLIRENDHYPEKYRLSIAVCYNRYIPPLGSPLTEFGLKAQPLGNGYGGGRWEISDLNQLLKAEPDRPNSTIPSIRPGEWLMLAQQRSATEQAFVWYRVTDVGRFNNTTKKLTVTLDGPDWPVGYPGAGPVTATIFPGSKLYQGVVAVYEKTVTIETTPMWPN